MDDLRARLSLETAQMAADHGFPLVVVDGSPIPEFRDALRDLGAIVFEEEERGMGAARRQAIREAFSVAGNDGAVCFMEPEKGPLIEHLPMCFGVVRTGDRATGADIVVPCRSPKSWQSYPRVQRLNEPLGNYSFELATRRSHLDMFFGPRVFNYRAAQLFLKSRPHVPGGDSWGTTHYPVIEAIALKYAVTGVMVDYDHPEKQRKAEDTPAFYMKRVTQVDQLAVGSFLYGMHLNTMSRDPVLLRDLAGKYRTEMLALGLIEEPKVQPSEMPVSLGTFDTVPNPSPTL